jgi:hypothetical protein
MPYISQSVRLRDLTESQWFYGNLGIDLLRQAQRVAINFRTMTTLKLDNARPQTH